MFWVFGRTNTYQTVKQVQMMVDLNKKKKQAYIEVGRWIPNESKKLIDQNNKAQNHL